MSSRDDAARPSDPDFLTGGGEMGALMRAGDWSHCALGPPAAWPQSLRAVVSLMLASRYPMFIAWGPQLAFVYNDGYVPILGLRHPQALGRPFADVWPEIWGDIQPFVDAALGGEATYRENLHLVMARNGYAEDTWYSFSYSPLRDETGAVAGMFCACTETTQAMLAARRREMLLRLDERLRDMSDTAGLAFTAAELLGEALGAARAGYGAVDAAAGTVFVERNWFAPGFNDLAGMHAFADYGSYLDDLRRGEIVANADVATDPRTAARTAAFDALGIRAHLDVPVIENGRVVGEIFVHSATPRIWSADEVALVRDVAERTRAAIARREAEQELRESEARFRALATVGASAIYRMSADWRQLRRIDGPASVVDDAARDVDWVEAHVPEDERARVRRVIADAIAGKRAFELEHRVRRADGAIGWLQSRAIPRLDADGAIVEWFGAVSDITQRVRADQSFNRLFQASPAPFLVLSPDAPRFTIREVNDAYLAATMTVRGDLVGRGVFEAFPDNPDDPTVNGVSTLRASLERVLASRAPHALPGLKYDIARPDGSFEERWWSPVNSPVLNENGEVEAIIHNANDVTDARRAEAALRASEERYRTLFENIDAAFCVLEVIFDATGRACDHRFIEANPAFDRQSGLTEAIGRRVSELLPEPDQQWLDMFGAVATTGEPARFENGSRALGRWFDVYALRIGDPAQQRVAVLFNDITQRKQAEERLRDLNDTLETQVAARSAERDRLWNLSQDMLARADYSGMMSAVSPAWTRVLGWSESELLSRGYATFMHPDDMTATLAAIGRMAETREPSRFENRIATRDGGWTPIEWTVAPEPDGINFIAVGRDLSAAKAREAELEAAQEALRQSQKLESMGQLTGGVAHDVNNLLTPIMGSLDLLRRRSVGGEREQRMIDGALQSAERARLLVQRLLAFARRQPLQPVAVDLAALVSGMAELIASTSGPRVRVELDLAPALPPARADANQLELAILNLAVNARDAMPDGGRLTIGAEPRRVPPGQGLGLAPGDYVRLTVADTGTGMDEPTLARAIEPFFSTKGIGKGTGLGLSMVHGLAAQLGGALTISSKPGLGTAVELWLPVSADAVPAEGRSAEVEPRPPVGTALVVDDEELVRLSTADMLADLGYAVVEAGSAEAALDLIEKGLAFDLLVTDHLMAGMTGTELARAVRSRRGDLPVLVVSGYADVEGIAPDLPRLTKPYQLADLAASLAALAVGEPRPRGE